MVIKSKLCSAVGIQHPIVCGGMHYVGYAELAAAVSNAGGLGIITALTQPTPEDLRREIRKCRTLTSKPFGVNITLLPSMVPPDYKGYCQVIIDEGVKVVETAGNNPGEYIALFKKHDVFVIHKCVAIRHAQTAERMGADMLSIDGFECAGHPGEDDVGNFVLLALAARSLKIPYIASGGVGTGIQLAAALALGAEGVNCGTAFMVTKEAPVHQSIKDAIVKATERDTTHVFRTLKNTERVYKNAASLKVVEIEKEHPGEFERIRPFVSGTMYKDSFQKTGDTQSSVWSCGQVAGLLKDQPTCKEFIERTVKECEATIRAMSARL